MTVENPDIDTDYLVSEYFSGKSTGELAREFGVTPGLVQGRLRKRGVKLRTIKDGARLYWSSRESPRKPPVNKANVDANVIANLYLGGMTEREVAAHLGTTRQIVRTRLKGMGITRSNSEAQVLKNSRMT